MKNWQFASKGGISTRTGACDVNAEAADKHQRGVRYGCRVAGVLLATVAMFASGCGTTSVSDDTVDAQRAAQERAERAALNQQLASAAVTNAATKQSVQREYPVGPGDMLDVAVFGVDDFDNTVRVDGDGSIMLPGVGELEVGGKTLREVEALVAERLTEIMHTPQVSVSVTEYRSQQVSVTGAVSKPALHTLSRPRTILELLAMSGGLAKNAGNQIYVQTTVDSEPRRLIIDLRQVLSNPDSEGFRLLLKGGDNIFVPEAGIVFVEGAVASPGAYPLKGGVGLIEAITLAGGETGVARTSDVQVVKLSADGEGETVSVDLDELRADRSQNVALKDGDIVHVPTSGSKSVLQSIKGIFSIGVGVGARYNPVGP